VDLCSGEDDHGSWPNAGDDDDLALGGIVL
jgi:hypothetical protein